VRRLHGALEEGAQRRNHNVFDAVSHPRSADAWRAGRYG
jgi:hypothetical protein